MTRPHFHSPPNLHGQMEYLADGRGVSTAEIYLVATKLLVNLDPQSDYDPNGSELLQYYLGQCDAVSDAPTTDFEWDSSASADD